MCVCGGTLDIRKVNLPMVTQLGKMFFYLLRSAPDLIFFLLCLMKRSVDLPKQDQESSIFEHRNVMIFFPFGRITILVPTPTDSAPWPGLKPNPSFTSKVSVHTFRTQAPRLQPGLCRPFGIITAAGGWLESLSKYSTVYVQEPFTYSGQEHWSLFASLSGGM